MAHLLHVVPCRVLGRVEVLQERPRPLHCGSLYVLDGQPLQRIGLYVGFQILTNILKTSLVDIAYLRLANNSDEVLITAPFGPDSLDPLNPMLTLTPLVSKIPPRP